MCKITKSCFGLNFTIFSARTAQSRNSICHLNGYNDVKHIVRVENRYDYGSTLKVTGDIRSQPNKIRFFSPNINITETQWTGSHEFSGYGEYTFDYVILLPNDQQSSTHEDIYTTITIEYSEPEEEISLEESIQVFPK